MSVPTTITLVDATTGTTPAIDISGVRFGTVYVRSTNGSWRVEYSHDGSMWVDTTGFLLTTGTTFNVVGRPLNSQGYYYLAVFKFIRFYSQGQSQLTIDMCFVPWDDEAED